MKNEIDNMESMMSEQESKIKLLEDNINNLKSSKKQLEEQIRIYDQKIAILKFDGLKIV